MTHDKGFEIANHIYKFGNGFFITFDNGVTVSVQFCYFHYCYNHNTINSYTSNKEHPAYGSPCECENAEVAIINKDGGFITKEYRDVGDDVLGYITPEELVDVMIWCKNYGK